jgi:hypothetical protein
VAVDCFPAARIKVELTLKKSDGANFSGHAANLALMLVLAGWLLLVWGVLRQLGDPSPMVPRAELEVARDTSLLFMFSGAAALVSSIWLSGRSFEHARVRAALALTLFVVPMFGLFVTAFRTLN